MSGPSPEHSLTELLHTFGLVSPPPTTSASPPVASSPASSPGASSLRPSPSRHTSPHLAPDGFFATPEAFNLWLQDIVLQTGLSDVYFSPVGIRLLINRILAFPPAPVEWTPGAAGRMLQWLRETAGGISLRAGCLEQRLREKGSADTTWVAGDQRFRVSVFFTRQQLAFVFRHIPPGIRYFSSLSLPPVVFTSLLERAHRGLFLLAGPAGSGKSTTLSACVQFWNHHTAQHIIVIEDPIEYIYESARSLIHQIEVGNDTLSFTDALHGALRQSPQTIVVGEIRSEDTARLALQAAETGHLVAGTIHAPHTFGALRRFTGFFPEVEQSRIWNRLVETFVAVISQILLPAEPSAGSAEPSAGSDDASPGVTPATRIPAIEILRSSFHIRQLLNSPHCTKELITEAMERARDEYMINLDDYLYLLVGTQRIRLETALTVAHSPSDLKLRAVSRIEKF